MAKGANYDIRIFKFVLFQGSIQFPQLRCSEFNSSSKIVFHKVQRLELVSKELNHFGVIAGLFRQIGGHSNRFVLFCSF